jgi:phage virion morphogenesis protein
MIKIQYNDLEVRQALNKLIQKGSDLTPAMRAIAGVFRDGAEQAFATETAPDGTPWEPLSEKTIKARAKKGTWPGKILTEKGQLASSITSLFGNDFALIGSNKKYAATQQFGRATANIPAREFLGVAQDDKDEILAILQDHLMS